MKIRDVAVITRQRTLHSPAPGIRQGNCHPLQQYAEFLPGPPPGPAPTPRELTGIFVVITAEDGTTGTFGPLYRLQGQIIRDLLGPFLVGRDALATTILQDQMRRLDRHGRSGYFLTAISAIDCALWDLKGKQLGQPVYRLLGGPGRNRLPAYASMLGFSIEPEEAAATAREMKDRGFPAQKWFFAHGPGNGETGLQANLAMAHAVREAVGPTYPLMFDAFMGWDVPYAHRMLAGLVDLQPTWVEEPLPPAQRDGFRRLHTAFPAIPLATGEHVYERHETWELLRDGTISVLQNDPDWTGGITGLQALCALASATGVPLVAHGHSLLPALHVAAAQPPAVAPWVEYLLCYQAEKQAFQRSCYEPVEGHLDLPTTPGLGIDLDPADDATSQPLTG